MNSRTDWRPCETVLLVVVWIASGWWAAGWSHQGALMVKVQTGQLIIGVDYFSVDASSYGTFLVNRFPFSVHLWFDQE